MFARREILKITRFNPFTQHYVVQKNWSTTRNINFLHKCKDHLNTVLRSQNPKENIFKLSHITYSARTHLEDVRPVHESPPVVPTQHSASVVIIGAGMAGLSAANHLNENGITNITVLEALNRPGGRIKSCWFKDSVIEMGLEISNDHASNPIMLNAFEDGFTNNPLNQADLTRGLLLNSDGSVIPYPITCEVYQKFKQIWNEAHKIDDEESAQGRFNIMEFVGSRIEQEVRTFQPNHQVSAERAFHGLASLASAKSVHDNSLIVENDFGNFIQLPGSEIKVPLGYFGEVNRLYESLPPEQVKFNKSVTKITWGGVSNVFPRAVVICKDGENFQADYVIITLPLGVLKELSESLFCPGLSASKLDAILKIPNGHSNKIFVEFSQPFWLWNRDFEKITFDVKVMECTKKGWLKGLSSIEPVKGSNHVMCATVVGPQAKCMECLPDKEIVCDILLLLKDLSGKQNIPEPANIKRTSWSSDPSFYGACSYMRSGITSQHFYNLASPLPEHTEYSNPVLLFGGEATSPVHFGTVEGAKSSGIREAERLLQLIKLQEETESDSEMYFSKKCVINQ